MAMSPLIPPIAPVVNPVGQIGARFPFDPVGEQQVGGFRFSPVTPAAAPAGGGFGFGGAPAAAAPAGPNPLLLAGLSILSGGDVGSTISGVMKQQAAARQEAFLNQLRLRDQALQESAYRNKLEQQGLSRAALARISEFPAKLRESAPPGSPLADYADAVDLAIDAAVYTGEGTALQGLIKDFGSLQTTNDIVGSARQWRTVAEKDLADASLNKRQAEEQRINRGNLGFRGAELAVRKGELAAKQKEGNAREQRISDMIGTLGVTRAEAIKLDAGFLQIIPDPVTGQNRLVDKVSGEERLLSAADAGSSRVAQAPAPEVGGTRAGVPAAPTIFEDIRNTYGADTVAADFLSATVGQIFEGANSPEVARARTRAGVLREELINAFAKSGRPPVVEQERILQNLPSLGAFESVPRAEAKLSELYSLLGTVREDDAAYADRRDVPPKARADAMERVRAIDRVMKKIGTPPQHNTGSISNPAKPTTQEDFDALRPGDYFINPADGQLMQKQ